MISLTTVFYICLLSRTVAFGLLRLPLFMVDTSGDLFQSLDVNWVKENKIVVLSECFIL